MIKEFEKLSKEEASLLFKAPVLVSVLVSCSYNEINKAQKGDAIKLAHLKTFTAKPALLGYYDEVDKTFKEDFELAVKKYYPFDNIKRTALKKEIEKINTIILKLDKDFGSLMYKSLAGYTGHVRKAAHSIFRDFIFPVEGLSD